MSFDKDYPNRKDQRKKFRGAKAIDRTCRCHGGCPVCEGNRTASDRRRRDQAEFDEKNFRKYGVQYIMDELEDEEHDLALQWKIENSD